MMELLEDVFIHCSRCGKVTGIHKEDFDFESYVYDRGDNRMVKKSNSVTRDTLNVINAIMKSPSECLATSTQ